MKPANTGKAEPDQPGAFTVDAAFDRCPKTVWSVYNCKSVATANSNVNVLSA